MCRRLLPLAAWQSQSGTAEAATGLLLSLLEMRGHLAVDTVKGDHQEGVKQSRSPDVRASPPEGELGISCRLCCIES